MLSVASPEFLIPAPFPIMKQTINIIISQEFLYHSSQTFIRILISFAFSALAAFIISLFMVRYRFFESFFEEIIVIGLAVPAFIWVLVLTIILGITNAVCILTTWLIATTLMIVNLVPGIKNLDKNLLEMAKVFEIGFRKKFSYVILPQLMPYVFASMRNGFAVSWKIVLLTEVFGLGNGLGYMINYQFGIFSIKGIVSWSLAIVLIMAVFEKLIFKPFEKKAQGWQQSIGQLI